MITRETHCQKINNPITIYFYTDVTIVCLRNLITIDIHITIKSYQSNRSKFYANLLGQHTLTNLISQHTYLTNLNYQVRHLPNLV